MPSTPPRSSIEAAQQDRAVVDAIVQAGLSARSGFSLVGGLAGQASRREDAGEVRALAEEAAQAAERAKNADMSLDAALSGDGRPGGEALRDAARTLQAAADAYETAADVLDALDEDGE
jgi:hypothetical protein